ncbi:MAG: hypothetical protein D6775_09335, partial [Caldilineae bacterium]
MCAITAHLPQLLEIQACSTGQSKALLELLGTLFPFGDERWKGRPLMLSVICGVGQQDRRPGFQLLDQSWMWDRLSSLSAYLNTRHHTACR